MPVTDQQLDEIVLGWNQYAESRPDNIDAADVLAKRDLNMYRGLGIENISELAMHLVQDRSVASMEMTMGHLYERVLEGLGPRKLSNTEKTQPGFRGIDFIQDTAIEHRLINLKAGLSTSNSDISTATVTNLSSAKQHWENSRSPDDNPLQPIKTECAMIRAVARGQAREQLTDKNILWLVGDAMWEYFGGGKAFLSRLGNALGRNPLDFPAYEIQIEMAAERLRSVLNPFELPGEDIDWDRLVSRYP